MDFQVPGHHADPVFSMANTPNREGIFEFVIRIYPGGLFSGHLADEIKVGDRLSVEGPFGAFRLRRAVPRTCCSSAEGPASRHCWPCCARWRSAASTAGHLLLRSTDRRDLCFEEEIAKLEELVSGLTFVPALSEPTGDDGWEGETGLITDVVERRETSLATVDAYVCGPPRWSRPPSRCSPGSDAARTTSSTTSSPLPVSRKARTDHDRYHRAPEAPERPPRSVPRVNFTDAEAGAKSSPTPARGARRYNYYVPAKRKQTHYEDVTVEVQPDPRHYLSQGWIYADGQVGYPLNWTKLKAWGVDEPEPVRGIGTGGGGQGLSWPAHGWHEFRDPNEEWEQTIYKNNANIVRQLNQNIENAQREVVRAVDPNWVTFVERSVGAWMHVEHILGLYVFAANERSCPTNMHNTVLAVNSAHKIRFAQDLALYNLTLSEEIEAFDGAAHVDAWNNDTEMQGVREVTEALTAVEDDWGEAMFATNVVFEPLLGELFRSGLVMQAAPGNGDFVTPTVMGAGEPTTPSATCWTKACFGCHDDRSCRPQQAAMICCRRGAPGPPRGAHDAAAVAVDTGHRGSRTPSTTSRSLRRIVSASADAPKELAPCPADGAVGAIVRMCGITLMNDQVGEVVAGPWRSRRR